MVIAVNTRLLIASKMDGIGWFTAETMRHITTSHPDVEFHFLFDRRPDPQFLYGPNVKAIVLPPPARHPMLWFIFFEISVALYLTRTKPDLYLSPDGFIPLQTKTPTLAVIHDINFEHDPTYLRHSHQRYMQHYFPLYARRATRVATVSEYSRADIAATYDVDPKNIDVVYNGSNSLYHPLNSEECQAVRNQYSQGRPYFIFVSTILKRKNLTGVLRAFDLYKQRRPDDESRLIVVGHRVWWQDELRETYENMRHKAEVDFVGHANVTDLSRMVGAAQALVYPSLFEGFGIPIVEAFSAGTPVITSNVTSMPEIAADAALIVDPHDHTQIADAMVRIATEPELRHSLIERGLRRSTDFSWQRSADLLWQSMMKTIRQQ